MNAQARLRYPTKAEIARVVEAAKAAGITPGGLECAPDGTIRVLSQQAQVVDDPYLQWKAGREGK